MKPEKCKGCIRYDDGMGLRLTCLACSRSFFKLSPLHTLDQYMPENKKEENTDETK